MYFAIFVSIPAFVVKTLVAIRFNCRIVSPWLVTIQSLIAATGLL